MQTCSARLAMRGRHEPTLRAFLMVTQVELPATLEELYTGCTKVVVHSRLAAPSSGGDPVAEPRRLSVAIEPGMPDGTTFMFEG